MDMDIVPFGGEHIPGAAALLSARLAPLTTPLRNGLPTVEAAVADLREVWAEPEITGVAAVAQGEVCGFLLGRVQITPPTSVVALLQDLTAVEIPYTGYGADPNHAPAVYAALYAAAATAWLARGIRTHYIEVATHDPALQDAWTDLGFARYLALAARPTVLGRTTPAPVGVQIRRATAAEAGAVRDLLEGLFRHQAEPPAWVPFVPEASEDLLPQVLQTLDLPTAAIWVAARADGTLLGMQMYKPPWAIAGRATMEGAVYLYAAYTDPVARERGIGTALLSAGLTWADQMGYPWCMLHYLTANPAARQFWVGQAFRPLTYRLCRTLDPRVPTTAE